MKTLFRFAFAAVLAAGAYSYSVGSENAVKIQDPEPQYTTVSPLEGGPATQQSGTFEELTGEDGPCHGDDQLCARQDDNPSNEIKWDGGSSKF